MRDPNFAEKLANDFSLRLEIEDQRRRLASSSLSWSPIVSMVPQRSSTTTMEEFRMLSSTSTLLLFTPVTKPYGYVNDDCAHGKYVNGMATAAGTDVNIDPFEMLGRALSKHYRRVRHVPYLPSVGFTETHEAFLKEADAVVVVMCQAAQPLDAGAASPNSLPSISVPNQVRFAEDAMDALDDVDVPLLTVHFGDHGDEQGGGMTVTHRPIYVSGQYNVDAVKRAVELLCGKG